MKFKMPRQVLTPEITTVIARTVKEQKLRTFLPKERHLKQLAHILQEIKTRGLPSNLVCKKLPRGLGSGIFLHPKADPIAKGEVIGPYAGRVSIVPQNVAEDALYAFEPLDHIHLTKEEQAHFDPARPYHPRRLYSMLVDALKEGNFARFINHSEKPNLIAEFFRIPKNRFGLEPSPIEVVYVTGKKILPGEQLLVSYEGDDHSYWSGLKIKPIPITPQTFRVDDSLKVISK